MRQRSNLLFIAVLLPLLAAAQRSVDFRAELESQEVVMGSEFQLNFILENASADQFQPPDFTGFKRLGGVQQMSGTTITNGRVDSKEVWSYSLEAPAVGTYTIGPASVRIRGQEIKSKPLKITVVAAGRQPKFNQTPNGHNDDLFVVGELNRDSAYVGEQLIYRIVLYTRLTVSGPDMVDLPEADKAYTSEMQRFDTRIRYENVHGQRFAVKTLYEMAVFPQSPGELTIDEAQLRVGVEQPGTFGALLGPRPVILPTNPITIPIKALPFPAPLGFTGGVGHFDWELRADRNTATTDDAITLSVSIRDNADGKRFIPPPLEVPDQVELIEPKVRDEQSYENGEEMLHSATVDYVMLPHRPGTFELQPKLVYFDPDSSRYITKTLPAPLSFTVTAGKGGVSPPVAPPVADTSTAVPLWQRFSKSTLLAALLLLLVLIAALGYGLSGSRKTRPAKPSTPLPTAGSSLRLPAPGPALEFYEQLYQLLQQYYSARLDLPVADWTNAELIRRMNSAGMDSAQAAALTGLLNRCEQILYAGQTGLADQEADRKLAGALLKLI